MAKEKKTQQSVELSGNSGQMTAEEAKAFRAALYKPPVHTLSEDEKREAFRIFWVSNKAKYGKGKSLEKAIWLHLKTVKMDSPEQFSNGLEHFGLKKIK